MPDVPTPNLKVQSFPRVVPPRPLKSKPSKRARPREPLRDRCEAGTVKCTGRPEHRHHTLRRSQGGSDEHTIDVCEPCHSWIHAHPKASYERGWLKRAEPVVCASCDEPFPSYPAAERHRDETGRRRFEVLGDTDRNPQ